MKIRNLFRKKKVVKPAIKSQNRNYTMASSWLASFATNNGYDGSKGYNLFGCSRDFSIEGLNYRELTVRAYQIYIANMYADQIMTRATTAVIGEGLALEAKPNRQILTFTDDEYRNWSNRVEALFDLWATDKVLIDHYKVKNFYQLQTEIDTERRLGDVLVVLRPNRETDFLSIQVIKGSLIRTPLAVDINEGHKIVDGVELDASNAPIAYWVSPENSINPSDFIRIPRFGTKTKRNIAFLVFGRPPLAGETRGRPWMSSVLEPLQQLALYTDYELNAAKINATLAMVIRNTKGEAPSMPFGGINVEQQTLDDAAGCNTMQYKALTDMPPGQIAQVLQHGEEIVSHNTQRPNVNFPAFVSTIKSNIASTLELPPEFVDLQYQNNFSASRQAGIDLGVYIKKERGLFSTQFNSIIYSEWLTNAVLSGIVSANGYIESLTNGNFFVKNAWQQADFMGQIRQSVDILKEARAYKVYADEAWMSREEITRRVGGGDFSVNVTKLKDENEQLADANEPLQVIDDTVVPLTDS